MSHSPFFAVYKDFFSLIVGSIIRADYTICGTQCKMKIWGLGSGQSQCPLLWSCSCKLWWMSYLSRRDSLRDWNLCSRTHYLTWIGVDKTVLSGQWTCCGVWPAQGRDDCFFALLHDAPDKLLLGPETSPWRVHPSPHWRMTMAESGPPLPTPLLM